MQAWQSLEKTVAARNDASTEGVFEAIITLREKRVNRTATGPPGDQRRGRVQPEISNQKAQTPLSRALGA